MPPLSNASAQLRGSAARLKAAGAVGVRAAMIKQLRAAAKAALPVIQEEARESLPKRGGMNEYVASRKPKVSVRTTGRQAGVSIKYSGPGRYSNESGWRHPVFGHRDRKWTTTTVQSAEHWWDRAKEKGTPEAQVAMRGVLDDVAAEIMRLGI